MLQPKDHQRRLKMALIQKSTYEGVGVVRKIQVHPIYRLFHTQDANGASGVALFYARMP